MINHSVHINAYYLWDYCWNLIERNVAFVVICLKTDSLLVIRLYIQAMASYQKVLHLLNFVKTKVSRLLDLLLLQYEIWVTKGINSTEPSKMMLYARIYVVRSCNYMLHESVDHQVIP